MSLTFALTFIRLFLWLLVYLLAPPFMFVLTFSGPLQSPRSCIAHPRGWQFPRLVLSRSRARFFSTSLPPTLSLPLSVCVYTHVGLRLLTSALSLRQSFFLFFFFSFPASATSKNHHRTRRVMAHRRKGRLIDNLAKRKWTHTPQWAKCSTGVTVSHPTVWPLTLHCGMSLMSQGSRLDWAVSSVSHASL